METANDSKQNYFGTESSVWILLSLKGRKQRFLFISVFFMSLPSPRSLSISHADVSPGQDFEVKRTPNLIVFCVRDHLIFSYWSGPLRSEKKCVEYHCERKTFDLLWLNVFPVRLMFSATPQVTFPMHYTGFQGTTFPPLIEWFSKEGP